MEKIIYLDNAATTKVHDSVIAEMNKYMQKLYANPSSSHSFGLKVRGDLERAREKIARTINASPDEIFFTSGGTEANNLAIKGLLIANPKKRHIISSEIEHSSIMDILKNLKLEGYRVDLVKVDKEGVIDLEDLKRKIRKDTLLVSIMHANNETGVLQPIDEISNICKSSKVFFHSDAVQSYLKHKIDVRNLGVDMMSFSGHKINAPKGIGFVYVKKGVKINPIINGGGQEKGLRSGTENVPAILALSKAVEIRRNLKKMELDKKKIIRGLLKIKGVKINGSLKNSLPNIISVSFYGIEGESLMFLLSERKIYVSTGSACASHKLEESHVLKAMQVDGLYIHGTIRISIDDSLTDEDINFIVKCIKESVDKLRRVSPFKLKNG